VKNINALCFIYEEEFSKYTKVDRATSKYTFDYFFDMGVEKFLSEKGKKYVHKLFEKGDPNHLQI